MTNMTATDSTSQRKIGVSFDDIPGSLPTGAVPKHANLDAVAVKAIEQLNNLTSDDLTSNAIWRDLFGLTHTFRTFHSRENVYHTLRTLKRDKHIKELSIKPASSPRISSNWVDIDIAFITRHEDLVAPGAGILSCLQCPDGVWRIWMLRTWLECFEGHGHPDYVGSRAASEEQNTAEPLGAIIVGGGQAGLSTAGHLHALGVSYLVIDQGDRLGENWRSRHNSLRLFTAKDFNTPPLGWRFPEEVDKIMPAKAMGDGYEAWAQHYSLNIRLNTRVTSARYTGMEKLWTVTTSNARGQDLITARNLVLAIGPGISQPVVPSWATLSHIAKSHFKGTIVHASAWRSARAWAGKRGIVVGSANNGHDIAEDMANASLHTTMIQRSPTLVLPVEWLHASTDALYNRDTPTVVADQEQATMPNKIARERTRKWLARLYQVHAARFDALENVGFGVDRSGDFIQIINTRLGGEFVDKGASARIVAGDIKVKSEAIKGLYADGLELESGQKVPADLIVLATGFNRDSREQFASIIGKESADRMSEFGGVDSEGEVRGFAKLSGHPNLYCIGLDVRHARYYSRFIGLAIQADVLGRPLKPYLEPTAALSQSVPTKPHL